MVLNHQQHEKGRYEFHSFHFSQGKRPFLIRDILAKFGIKSGFGLNKCIDRT